MSEDNDGPLRSHQIRVVVAEVAVRIVKRGQFGMIGVPGDCIRRHLDPVTSNLEHHLGLVELDPDSGAKVLELELETDAGQIAVAPQPVPDEIEGLKLSGAATGPPPRVGLDRRQGINETQERGVADQIEGIGGRCNPPARGARRGENFRALDAKGGVRGTVCAVRSTATTSAAPAMTAATTLRVSACIRILLELSALSSAMTNILGPISAVKRRMTGHDLERHG